MDKAKSFDWKIIALIALGWYGYTHQTELDLHLPFNNIVTPSTPKVDPPGSVTINGATVDLKQVVEPVRAILKAGAVDKTRNHAQDCAHLGDYWNDFAEVLLTGWKDGVPGDPFKDKVYIKTNDDVRRFNAECGVLCLGKESIKGQYEGLPKAVDNAIIAVVPLQAKTLSQEDKANLDKLFKALRWAAYSAI